jgi:hypothetical protein
MTRAFDPKPDNIAVAQLVHLHADLGGKLLACQAQASRLASDMRHVEAVIRMFDPSYDVRRIAVRRRNAKRGTVFRAALGVLRGATGPLTTKDICLQLLAAKGTAEPTREQVRDMIGAVHRSLVNHEGKPVAKVGDGIPARWVLAGND